MLRGPHKRAIRQVGGHRERVALEPQVEVITYVMDYEDDVASFGRVCRRAIRQVCGRVRVSFDPAIEVYTYPDVGHDLEHFDIDHQIVVDEYCGRSKVDLGGVEVRLYDPRIEHTSHSAQWLVSHLETFD